MLFVVLSHYQSIGDLIETNWKMFDAEAKIICFIKSGRVEREVVFLYDLHDFV